MRGRYLQIPVVQGGYLQIPVVRGRYLQISIVRGGYLQISSGKPGIPWIHRKIWYGLQVEVVPLKSIRREAYCSIHPEHAHGICYLPIDNVFRGLCSSGVGARSKSAEMFTNEEEKPVVGYTSAWDRESKKPAMSSILSKW